MSKFVLALLLVFGPTLIAATAQQQNSAQPDQAINNAGSNVKAEDDASIHNLVDSVFEYPHTYPHLPPATEATVKDRLFRAEKDYLAKRGPGVQEQSVADAMNLLADKISAPAYAKTRALQVRYMRMNLALSTPSFMGRRVARPDAKIGDSINPEMSPTQAFHLLASTIDQKFVNPDFQKPPDEWDQDFPNLLKANQDLSRRGNRTQSNPKRLELDGAFGAGLSPLSDNDGTDLANQVLATLGIK